VEPPPHPSPALAGVHSVSEQVPRSEGLQEAGLGWSSGQEPQVALSGVQVRSW
jgi:hypothetical protein